LLEIEVLAAVPIQAKAEGTAALGG